MDPKQFLEEVFRLVIYSIYPLFVLYSNFVFLGLFVLSKNVFPHSAVLIFFVIIKILLTFSILYFVLLSNTDSKSTQDIFPLASEFKTNRNFKNINPFIADTLLEKSIEKTHICSTCQTYKPPRCHHCSRCNRCYLKYDHHCLFLDACIGFHNYKFFLQFLISNFLYVVFYTIVILLEFGMEKQHTTSITVNVIIFTVVAVGIIFVTFQTILVQFKTLPNNETFIEFLVINEYLKGDHSHINVFQEGPITEFSDSKDRKVLNPYNLGLRQNLKAVFGSSVLEWISPSFTSIGDGISFVKNTDSE